MIACIFFFFLQFTVTTSVLHQLLPKGNKAKWLVAAGLSQLSEFSFVLGSRARRYGLISREVCSYIYLWKKEYLGANSSLTQHKAAYLYNIFQGLS